MATDQVAKLIENLGRPLTVSELSGIAESALSNPALSPEQFQFFDVMRAQLNQKIPQQLVGVVVNPPGEITKEDRIKLAESALKNRRLQGQQRQSFETELRNLKEEDAA